MIEIIKHGKYFNQYHCNCNLCGCEWIGGLIDKCTSNVCSCPECGHTTLEMYTKMISLSEPPKENMQNKVETREVEEYYIHIDSNDGYIAKRIMAYDLEDAKRQVIKYFSQDKGKTVVIRPKHSKKAVKVVIK